MDRYDDIIDTKWPLPSLRVPMALNVRAKIFLPFAALTGYDELIASVEKESVMEADQIYSSLEEDEGFLD